MIERKRHRKNDRVVFEQIEIERGRLRRSTALDLGVAVIAEVDVAEEVDREKANWNLIGLDDSIDVDDRRESHTAPPERLQLQQQIFIESGIGRDLIVRASGDGVDRLAKGAQRALIGQRDRDDHADSDRDAEECQQRSKLLAQHWSKDERAK